jgi:hypothetical protein
MKSTTLVSGGRTDPPAVRYLGPKNTEAVVGHGWRWCRDHAKAWGVPVLRVDAKPLIPAAEFFAALEAHAEPVAADVAEPELNEADELARMRAKVAAAGRG